MRRTTMVKDVRAGAAAGSTGKDRMQSPPPKATREMTVIAQDPSVKGADGRSILMSKVTVPAEILAAGPRGYRIHVVDYDSTTMRYHGAHAIPARYEDEPK